MSNAEPLILLVEDYKPVLSTLRMVLEAQGYRVAGAGSGAEALRVMEEVQPDLIISDIIMPDMDGYAFYKAVRSPAVRSPAVRSPAVRSPAVRAHPEWESIPFMFLTARADEWTSMRARSLGVDCTITKPFRIADLLSAVGHQLERAARLDERRALERMLTLKPTEADVDRLLEYVCRNTEAEAPQLDSLWLCGQPTRWDLSLLRGDQLDALDAAAMCRPGSYPCPSPSA